MKRNTKKPAFTLIELLVVIVIIGILSAISVAAFSNFQAKARLAKAQIFASQSQAQLLSDSLARAGDAELIHWVFEDGDCTTVGGGPYATDISGNGYDMIYIANYGPNGVLTQSTDLPVENGHYSCLNKNMAMGLVNFSFASAEAPNGLSFGFWVKPTAVQATEQVIFMITKNGNFVFHVTQDDDQRFTFEPSGSSTISFTTLYSEPANLDEWHYIMVSMTEDDVYFWVDGDYIGTSIASSTIDIQNAQRGVLYGNNPGRYFYDVVSYPALYLPN